jgi:hypothetical protein
MARIEKYNIDTRVTDGDKFIGTDAAGNVTRNYRASSIADYLNNYGKIGIGGQLSYRFTSNISGGRPISTITFEEGGGDDTGFSLVNSILISKYNTAGIDVSQYLQYLAERTILLFQLNNPNYFAEYRLNSATQNIDETDFFDISLTYVDGNGSFDNNEYYGITASANIVGDKTYRHIQGVSSNTWTVNHGLNKYPSVSVQDSAGTTVIGDITYNDKNTITLTFSGAFSGEAHFN